MMSLLGQQVGVKYDRSLGRAVSCPGTLVSLMASFGGNRRSWEQFSHCHIHCSQSLIRNNCCGLENHSAWPSMWLFTAMCFF